MIKKKQLIITHSISLVIISTKIVDGGEWMKREQLFLVVAAVLLLSLNLK